MDITMLLPTSFNSSSSLSEEILFKFIEGSGIFSDLLSNPCLFLMIIYRFRKQKEAKPDDYEPLFQQLYFLSAVIVITRDFLRIQLLFISDNDRKAMATSPGFPGISIGGYLSFFILSFYWFLEDTIICTTLLFSFLSAVQRIVIMYQPKLKVLVTGKVLKVQILMIWADDEPDEDFSAFLSEEENVENNVSDCDEEEAGIPWEKAEEVESPEEIEIPREQRDPLDLGTSLLDSLLGEALSGEEEIRVEGLFDDLEDEEAPEKIDRKRLEDDDSGIEVSQSASEESNATESKSSEFSIDTYLQYIAEEEHAVPIDDVPDFASKKNVYGTTFNIRTGSIHRPPRFEFARRDTRWIDTCKEMTFDPKKPVRKLLTLGKIVETVQKNTKIDLSSCKSTDVYCKTAEEMAAMETHHIQQIIRDAFNSRRLAVLLLGVDKNGLVTGCKTNPGKQDNLRLALDTAIQTEFVPPVENVLDAIDIKFVRIDGEKDTHLIVIRVKQLRNQKYFLKSEME